MPRWTVMLACAWPDLKGLQNKGLITAALCVGERESLTHSHTHINKQTQTRARTQTRTRTRGFTNRNFTILLESKTIELLTHVVT